MHIEKDKKISVCVCVCGCACMCVVVRTFAYVCEIEIVLPIVESGKKTPVRNQHSQVLHKTKTFE